MGNNKLKLNTDKLEFIVICDDQIRSSLKASFPVFFGNIMEPAESVKNLGVILWMLTIQYKDTWLIYVAYVTNLCRNYEGSAGI